MKSVITAIAAVLLFAGCQEEASKPSASSPGTAKPAMASEAAKTASTASTAKPASAKEYYEVKKSGKTYVFGDVNAMAAFPTAGTVPAGAIEKPGPNGETVVYQAGGMEAGLMVEYAKSHPKK